MQVGVKCSAARIADDRVSGNLGDQRDQRAVVILKGGRCIKSCADEFANAREQRLQSGSAREIGFGPQEPAANFLIFRERAIGIFDHCRLIRMRRIFEQQHGARLCVTVPFDSYHYAIAHAGLAAHRSFQILGIDVHTRRSDDHIFPAAFEIEAAFRVGFPHISSAKPPIGCRYRLRLITLAI